MAKIKLTKNELKAQRDALKRFSRYLPTLQLKKQQLQMEMRRLDQEIHEKKDEEQEARAVSIFRFLTNLPSNPPFRICLRRMPGRMTGSAF